MIPVYLNTTEAVSAARIAVTSDWLVGSPLRIEHEVPQWRTFLSDSGDSLRVLLLDETLSNPLSGQQLLFQIVTDIPTSPDREIHLLEAEVGFNTSPPTYLNAMPTVTTRAVPAQIVSLSADPATPVQGDLLKITAVVRLQQPAAALQFDLHVENAIVGTFGEASLDPQTGPRLYANVVASDRIRILLADTGHPAGGVAEDTRIILPFRLSRVTPTGEFAIQVENALTAAANQTRRPLLAETSRLTISSRPNTPPRVTPDGAVRTWEGADWSWKVPVADDENDPVFVTALNGPAWMKLESGKIYGSPAETEVGEWPIAITLSDSTATVETRLSVQVENTPPEMASLADQVLWVGKTLTITPEIQHCPSCRIEIAGLPNATFSDNRLLWTGDSVGSWEATVVAEDAFGGQDTAVFAVEVTKRPSIVIDEILANPPAGLSGDANGDGVRSGFGDEFIEILNTDTRSIDISGWTLSDDDTRPDQKFRFPQGTTLHPGERAVLFGEGDLDTAGWFSDDGRIGNGLTNSGDRVLLIDSVYGDTIDSAAYEATGKYRGSIAREAGHSVPHEAFPGREPMSPGRPRALFDRLSIHTSQHLSAEAPESVAVSALYSDGVEIDITESVDWVTSHPEIAVEDRLISASRAGNYAVSARWESARQDIQITVGPRLRALGPAMIAPPDSVLRVGARFCYRPLLTPGPGVDVTSSLPGFPSFSDSLCWIPREAGDGEIYVHLTEHGAEWTGSYKVRIDPAPSVRIAEVFTATIPQGDHDTERHHASEFVELHNWGSSPVDISGWIVTDGDVNAAEAFTFPPGAIIQPNGFAVLFGGSVTADAAYFDDGSIGNGLDGTTEVLYLVDPALNDTVDAVTFRAESEPGSSIVRTDDGWRVNPVPSPGKANTDSAPDAIDSAAPVPRLRLSEIHAAPASGIAGDANVDGKRDAYEDEFVEIANEDTTTVDLAGWSLVTARSRFTFDRPFVLSSGQRGCVFGGGDVSAVPRPSTSAQGRLAGGLPNSGGFVLLESPNGAAVDRVVYPASRGGASVVFEAGASRFHNELPGRNAFSPGVAGPRLVDLRVQSHPPDPVAGEPITFTADGVFDDESVAAITDNVTIGDVNNVFTFTGTEWVANRSGLHLIDVRAPGIPARTVSIRIRAREPQTAASTPDTSHAFLPDHPNLSAGITILSGVPFALPLTGKATIIDSEGTDWLHSNGQLITGTPGAEDEGSWSITIEGAHATETVTVRVVTPEAVLGSAPDAGQAGVTWIWPIASDGMEVQAGRVGHFDRSRKAIVWKPEEGQRGSQSVEAALSAPGWDPIVLTKVVTIADRPGIRITGLVATPDIDRNADGAVDEGDELIELYNAGQAAVDVSRWTLGDDDRGSPYTFPEGLAIQPGDTVQVLGSAPQTGYGSDGRIGNGLAADDRIYLIAPAGPDTILAVAYTSRGARGLLRQDPGAPERWVAEDPGAREVEPGAVQPDATQTAQSPPGLRVVPHPVRGCTEISMEISVGRSVDIVVYNALGQTVSALYRGYLEAGDHDWPWCPGVSGLAAGTYFIVDARSPQSGVARTTFLH